jgi:hypothetical protein
MEDWMVRGLHHQPPTIVRHRVRLGVRTSSATPSIGLVARHGYHNTLVRPGPSTSPLCSLSLTLHGSSDNALAVENFAELERALHRTTPRPILPIAPPWAPLSPHPICIANWAKVRPHCHSSIMETLPEFLRAGAHRGPTSSAHLGSSDLT